MCSAGRRDRRAITYLISHEQQQRSPRSKVNRWLRLAAPCILALGGDGQRHRPSSTRAHISYRTSRYGGRAVLNPSKTRGQELFWAHDRATTPNHRSRSARVADVSSGLRSLCLVLDLVWCVYVHFGRCLCDANVRFSAASVRRTIVLMILVLTATRRPRTPDLRTTSRCLPALYGAVYSRRIRSSRATRSTRHTCCRSRTARSHHASRTLASSLDNCRAP